MRTAAAVTSSCALALAGACSEPPQQTPEEVLARIVGLELAGAFGRSYELIHPAHRALVGRADYVACRRAVPRAGGTEAPRVAVVRTAEASAGGPEGSEALELIFRPWSSARPQTALFAAHDGRWRRLLPRRTLDAYARGACPVAGAGVLGDAPRPARRDTPFERPSGRVHAYT